MDSNNFLVGDLLVASVVIKTLISVLKQYLPSRSGFYVTMSLVFGILSAFLIDLRIFHNLQVSGFGKFFQQFLTGVYIGAAAIGTHETSKLVRKP